MEARGKFIRYLVEDAKSKLNRNLTNEEIKDVLSFVQSPLGKKSLKKFNEINARKMRSTVKKPTHISKFLR